MTYPWDILNISPKSADQTAVKRAYAQQLKKCRPDENPEGFQALIKARDQALWLLENLDIIQARQEENVPPSKESSQEEVPLVQFSHDYFEIKLKEMAVSKAKIWDKEPWEKFLNDLNQATFSCRQDIEWLVIDTIGTGLMAQQARLADPEQKKKCLWILSLLNEAFNWDKDDQKVYHVLTNSDADFMLGLLRADLFEQQNSSTFNTVKRVPYIAIPDLRAYMGGKGEDIIYDYLGAWHRNQWQYHFNWSGFLLSYKWQAWRSFWQMAIAIIMLQIFCITVLGSEYFTSTTRKVSWSIFFSALPLIIIARYGNYLIIQAAHRAILRAEKLAFSHAIERYNYLQNEGRSNAALVFILLFSPFFLFLLDLLLYNLTLS